MDFEEIKKQAIALNRGKDPFTDPATWPLLERRLPRDIWPCLIHREGAAEFVVSLRTTFVPDKLAEDDEGQLCWERVGNFFKNQNRYYEAVSVYAALYEQLLLAQEIADARLHKAVPLTWMSDCYSALGSPVLAKRHLMLSFCETALTESGKVSPDKTGTYFRLVWGRGLPHSQFEKYAESVFDVAQSNPLESRFPEWLLQELDQDWMTEVPSFQEVGVYVASTPYLRFLIARLGDGTGRTLERLADYVASCMPGCRTKKRAISPSTDYDIVCSMDGVEIDFRSELGRYFVCECKDWAEPADFSAFAKFCRVLDSTKSRFGILFSSHGISGEGRTTDAVREQLKVFQDRGMVIVVVDREDLERVAKGANFINLLRSKYEDVRLDLKGPSRRGRN